MPILLLLLAACAGVLLPSRAVAQAAPAMAPAGPVVRAMLFGDATYLVTDRDVPDGFVLGQLVGHLNVGLTDRLNLFTELTATPHPTEYALEVERVIVRYDFSDLLKLSLGRYHTPIGYWNTAFHHGAWLQTSVGRPEAVKFGSRFVPVHFVGVLAEGMAPGSALGLGYSVGLGNGRGGVISRAGDAGDVNDGRAWMANLSARPAALLGLRAGVGYYHDRVTPSAGGDVGEGIASAYLALERERPELIAEYEHVDHDPRTGAASVGSDAFFLQAAYRLPGGARAFKPYARLERIDVGRGDPVLAGDVEAYRAALAGLRFDFAAYAALKAEYRLERFDADRRSHGFYLQASFVAPILSGESGPTP